MSPTSRAELRRELTRIVFLVEVFGNDHTRSAIDGVVRSEHVGAEYVECVLRHRRQRAPMPPPLKLGRPDLDDLDREGVVVAGT